MRLDVASQTHIYADSCTPPQRVDTLPSPQHLGLGASYCCFACLAHSSSVALVVLEAELVNDALLVDSFVKLLHPRAPCALLAAGKGGLVLAPLD